MKKSNLIIAAAALVMASCAQNEVLFQDFKETAIGFAKSGIENNTRAALTDSWFITSGNAFGVYGYKGSTMIFQDETVTWNGEDWKNPTVRFWDKSAQDYCFYAYAPKSATNSFNNGKFTFTGLSLIKDIASADADIAIATPLNNISYYHCTGGNTNGHGTGHVEFIFNHILSKLSFKIKENGDFQAASADVKVKNIDICFPTATGIKWAQAEKNAVSGEIAYDSYASADAINASGEASMASGDAASYNVAVFSGAEDISTTAETIGNTYIVAPVNDTYTSHKFAIRVTYDVKYTDLNDAVTDYAYGVLSYEPTSNSYHVVTITIDPEEIQFCVDKINEWTPASGDAHETTVK